MPTYLLTNEVKISNAIIRCKLLETNSSPSSDYTTIADTKKVATCKYFMIKPLNKENASVDVLPSGITFNGWQTEGALNGSFAAGNWTFKIKAHATTKYGTQVVECWVRLWRTNEILTEKTALTDWLEFPSDLTIPDNSACSTVADTLVSSLPEIILINEYLFAEYAYYIHTAGDASSCETGFVCDEAAGEEITTTTFTEVGSFVLAGSRIANATRTWQEDEDVDVAGWIKTNDFIYAQAAETESGKSATGDLILLWRNKTDGGSFGALGPAGELTRNAVTDLVNDNAVTSGEAGCTGAGTWQDGVEREGSSAVIPTALTPGDKWTEHQWAVDCSNAHDGDEYEFQLWDNTAATAVGTCLATITMAVVAVPRHGFVSFQDPGIV